MLELFFKEIKVEFKSEIIELKKPSGLNLKCIFLMVYYSLFLLVF